MYRVEYRGGGSDRVSDGERAILKELMKAKSCLTAMEGRIGGSFVNACSNAANFFFDCSAG